MSKIVPKSTQSQSSQNIKANQTRNENTDSDVMFAALFGGATGETSSEESLIGKTSMTTMMSADSGDENSFDEQTNDDLMLLMASLRGGSGLEQKVAGLQDDAINDGLELEQGSTSSDSENSDALALTTTGALLSATQGGTTAMQRSALAGLASMVFEDGVGSNARKVSAAANVVPKNPARVDGVSLLGQNKVSTEIIEPQQVKQKSVKVGENLGVNAENPVTKNMTSDLVKLSALRAANLEQKNAEFDAKLAKDDAGEVNGNLRKNNLTGAGLKQMTASANNQAFGVKMMSNGEGGRIGNDITRLAAASSSALDNASTIGGTGSNGSSTGHSGGQLGQQGGSQAGSQSGGGLLSSLNNLQILDTAKDNWTEMLLQRVKNGLSGGKDQLDFQLNPRNLGKMRISLVMQNDRTNIKIQTETSAAASMLGESEARLAQMLEASGLRLGNLNSGQFQGFGGAGSDQQANQQSQNKTGSLSQPDNGQDEGEVGAELVAAGSDNLINIQA